jgi:hypothetical protein
MQSPLEASVQELCNARVVEEFAHMDQNGPPVPPSVFLLRSASERASADIDPPPELCGNDPRDGPSVAVYYRDEAEVRDGFLIALRAMGLAGAEQHSEPSTPPAGGAKP